MLGDETMNLNQIKYLAEINRHHSIRQAGEHLYITSQALGQSIAALEKELNLKLIESSRTGTFLTQTGRILLEAGEEFAQVIEELQNSSSSITSYKYLPKANLSILTLTGLSNTLLAKISAYFYQEYPKIQITTNTRLNLSKILTALSAEEIEDEFAFISIYHYKNGALPDLTNYPNLTFKPLTTSKYCCSVPKNHEVFHYKNISLSTVLNYPIVISSGADTLLPILKAYGTPKKITTIAEYPIFNQFLKQDVSHLTFERLSSSFEASLSLENRKLIPLKEDISVSFGYIYRSNHRFSPLAIEFLDATSKFCKNHYGEI